MFGFVEPLVDEERRKEGKRQGGKEKKRKEDCFGVCLFVSLLSASIRVIVRVRVKVKVRVAYEKGMKKAACLASLLSVDSKQQTASRKWSCAMGIGERQFAKARDKREKKHKLLS